MKTLSSRGGTGLRSPRSFSGFSLIEVTIAIAITAIGLLALLGMLPQGMKTMQEAGDRALEARIQQQILGEILLTNWDNRAQYDYRKADGDGLRYYDDQGIELDKSRMNADDFDFRHVYTARVHVPDVGDTMPRSIYDGKSAKNYSGVQIPAEGNASFLDKDVQLVVIEISSVTDPNFDFDDSDYFSRIRTFQSSLVKMGFDFNPNVSSN